MHGPPSRSSILSTPIHLNRCPICDNPIAPDDRFCERCGADLQAILPASSTTFELPTAQEAEREKRRRRRSKSKRWYNRWPARIAALILILAGAVAAFGVWRLDQTMGNLNQVSTLPSQIQDQTAQNRDGSPVADVTVVIPTRPAGPPSIRSASAACARYEPPEARPNSF